MSARAMMTIYYHFDGSYTISRVARDRSLEHESVRIVGLKEDGSIVVLKDRYGVPRELLTALPVTPRSAS